MPTDWASGEWGMAIDSSDELLSVVFNLSLALPNRRYVWRGVKDHSLRMRTSLQRHLVGDNDAEDPPTEIQQRDRERQLLDAARRWGLNEPGFRNDLALLAKLQHFGIPTRLLDVTDDPLVAIWFACEDDGEKDGVLFGFDVTEYREVATVHRGGLTWADVTYPKAGGLKGALRVSAEMSRPVVITPTERDARMTAQGARFLLGVRIQDPTVAGLEAFDLNLSEPTVDVNLLKTRNYQGIQESDSVPFLAIRIPQELKTGIRDLLARSFNRRQEALFPDIEGFARAISESTYRLLDIEMVDDEGVDYSYPKDVQERLYPGTRG